MTLRDAVWGARLGLTGPGPGRVWPFPTVPVQRGGDAEEAALPSNPIADATSTIKKKHGAIYGPDMGRISLSEPDDRHDQDAQSFEATETNLTGCPRRVLSGKMCRSDELDIYFLREADYVDGRTDPERLFPVLNMGRRISNYARKTM